jgi:hypothetical protein
MFACQTLFLQGKRKRLQVANFGRLGEFATKKITLPFRPLTFYLDLFFLP